MGQYSVTNQARINLLTERDWKVALAKCKAHIKLRLKQKTLWGVHKASNLGADPVDHYLSLAYEKILAGEWEWRPERSLVEQMIRIVNSSMSTEVEKAATLKAEKFKLTYTDIEDEFYSVSGTSDNEAPEEYESRLRVVKDAIRGEADLEFVLTALTDGYKRSQIADLMDLRPKQFDKVREKLINRVQKFIM